MGQFNAPSVIGEMNTTELANLVAMLIKELDFLNGYIDNTNIKANSITAEEIAANTITANQIAANTITADQIASNTITADRMNVTELSAISANLGSITAGIITGILIRTASSGRRIELSGSNFTAYDSGGDARVTLYEDAANDRYEIRFGDETGSHVGTLSGTSGQLNIQGFNKIVMGGDIFIDPTSDFDFQGASVDFTSATIIGLSTDTEPDHNHGIPDGTVLQTAGGGTVTFRAGGSHSHVVES